MTEYAVTAKRWDRGWELHIGDLGVTQSHGLADADRMVRSWLSITGHADAATANLVWAYVVDDDFVQRQVETARDMAREAAKAQGRASEVTHKAVRLMVDRGFRPADIARIMGVSKQRISQLLAA